MKSVYKRIILKVSGEALQDENDHSIYDRKKLEMIADVVKEACDAGTQVGIVVGAGNIWRMAIQNAVELKGIECRVMSAINVPQCCEPYIRRKAVHHLEKGRVVVFAGGTGNPYFTTDSCATLRALEVGADAILMAKNGVDGVFDSDPRKNPNAKMIKRLSFHEVVNRQLGVMDLTAVAMLQGKDIQVRVFNMDERSNFEKVLKGEDVGTTITKED